MEQTDPAHDVSSKDLAELLECIEDFEVGIEVPPLWTGNIELALIDSVLANGELYAIETSPRVLEAVKRYQDASGRDSWDDLSALVSSDRSRCEDVLKDKQEIRGVLKTDAMRSAAKNLTLVGVRHAVDVDRTSREQRKAFTEMMSAGPVSWFYFTLLAGTGGVKADKHVLTFVGEALGRKVSRGECVTLLNAAANRLGVPATVLDHAIWRYTGDAQLN